MILINKEKWNNAFDGFNIYDCAVRNKDAFSFVCIKATKGKVGDEPNKRLINVFIDSGDVEFIEYTGFAQPLLTVARKPLEQAVMVGIDGDVAVLGSGKHGLETEIPMGRDETPLFTSAAAIATIDGYVYAAGNWRTVCRRTAAGVWENIADRKTLSIPERNENGSNDDGFDAIDGFNDHDIYCGGGKGDLWRFDGLQWHHCSLPTNMYIESICCAGDGYVYIGMQSGSILRGRDNKWKMIHEGKLSLPFKDLVWFDGVVWCTSDYGIWAIKDGKVREANVEANTRSCSGNLSVGDGVMLLAGMYGASIFDGNIWKKLGPDE